MVREKLISDKILSEDELIEPKLATKEQITLVHTTGYFDSFENGSIQSDIKAIRRLGFPWSYGLYLRSLASVGGAIESADEALRTGFSGNLAGGTHHAFSDYGEGFCVFNDFAIVSRYLQNKNSACRIAIIDLDVHQATVRQNYSVMIKISLSLTCTEKIIIRLRKFLLHLIWN